MAVCGAASLSLMRAICFIIIIITLAYGSGVRATPAASSNQPECPVFFDSQKQCDPTVPSSFLPDKTTTPPSHSPDRKFFADFLNAMDVMQSEFFAPWLGTWPDSIDWTAAVMGTHISAALRSVSEDLYLFSASEDEATIDWRSAANHVDNYFTQITAYYFGQDAFAIRQEAYDDILWVVLGWLETIRHINTHNSLHYRSSSMSGQQHTSLDNDDSPQIHTFLQNQTYHGSIWIPAFSHRARVFWDLASHGWDTKLCGGGMVWNPRLLPYKNAITNELYIAASISMYLYFPGDDNQSPFLTKRSDKESPAKSNTQIKGSTRDPKYLIAALEGYRWLQNSNMTNSHGLFIDGFHISGYADRWNPNTKCDQRNDMVFTYNQGVILTGQRGLWESTGTIAYLEDGHQLIQNTIQATGFNITSGAPMDPMDAGQLPPWRGLGRLGVMEDACDASGTCSQDVQTFKGIFFHHLAAFCAPLTRPPSGLGLSFNASALASVQNSHSEACLTYSHWLAHNVHAAKGTLDAEGKFGSWWTAGLLAANWTGPWPTVENDGVTNILNGTDYRDYGIPDDDIWGHHGGSPLGAPKYGDGGQRPMGSELRKRHSDSRDPNKRGRGRTVETQGGGLALLRAYWKIAQPP
ncbi:glycosyl hydrolase family 76-domain-containing protein [Xylariaceae sp. FL0016]|nr:glycosyl hydrolase family 76-domain-containing protein [Xylariaceae sp. FL0016]